MNISRSLHPTNSSYENFGKDEESSNEILWSACLDLIKKHKGEEAFNAWFCGMKFVKYSDDTLFISVPKMIVKVWLEDNYMNEILKVCKIFFQSATGIEIFVSNSKTDSDFNNNCISEDQNNGNSPELNEDELNLWHSIEKKLKNKYENEIEELSKPKISNKVMSISSKTTLKKYITEEIKELCLQTYREIESVEISVRDSENKSNNEFETMFGSPLDKRFTFESFVVGKPNELAFTAAKRVAEADSPVPGSNPLFLYGGVGLGKTHLMHAIAWYIIKNTGRKVVYLSAEKFMYSYVSALRSKDMMSFKNALRSVDVLMVDDVQFISGKDGTQEEFFHTFNALIDNNKQLVISADRSPSDLDGVEERIRSRLGWGLVADINESTFELRLGILQSKVENLGVNIDRKVLEFLAKSIRSNIRELEGALNKVIINASLHNVPITIEFVRETLEALLRSYSKIISVDEIKKKVAEFFGIRSSDMSSYRRSRNLARPRQVAMYLSKLLTSNSLQDIGRNFARDHATVIHATKQVEKLMDSDTSFREDVQHLLNMLK